MTRRRGLLFLGAALLLGAGALLPAQTLTTLRTSGPRASSLNIVFLGDGYTAAEAGKFDTDARAKLQTMLADEAFVRFADAANAFAIFVASAESGTDNPAQNIARDTYFNSSFGFNGINRLLTIPPTTPTIKDPAQGTGKVIALLQQFVPDYDIVVLLVNTTVYGGAGGFPTVTSLNASSDEILLHELGHSFAGLTDEYVDSAVGIGNGPFEYANATQKTARAQIVWRDFIMPTTALPTTGASTDANFVGLFEGSHYRASGIYRPTFNSKMRSLGQPFGPVNLRAFANAIHRLNLNGASAAPTITLHPAGAALAPGQSHTLRVAAAGTGPLTYQWRRDGTFIAGATGPELTLTRSTDAIAGSYLAEVTNASGSTVSLPATIGLAAAGTPVFTHQPASAFVVPGQPVTLAATASGAAPIAYQWFRDGQAIAGATSATYTLAAAQPAHAGSYHVVATNAVGSTPSASAVLGFSVADLFVGEAVSEDAWRTIRHPNGNLYSQVLLTGPAATVRALPGQITRISFVDLQDDIVQLEFSGAGTMTVTLAGATAPAWPANYNQAVLYVKGHASVTIHGADATTHFSAFSVGPLTAINPALFRSDVAYDGHADLARLSIHSATGEFGSIRAANTAFSDATGFTGILASGVSVAGPVRLHDLRAYDTAEPALLFGATPNADDGVLVAGGDMAQDNNRAVRIAGLNRIVMAAGTDSHRRSEPAQVNRATYTRDGVDVTATVVRPAAP